MTLQDVQQKLAEITANAGSDLALFQQQVNNLNAEIEKHLQETASSSKSVDEPVK